MFGPLHLTKWGIEKMTGYKPKTTFWNDFEIAEQFGGIDAVLDTYKQAFKSWKDNCEYITELVMVLNWRIWYWHGKDEKYEALYDKLWWETHQWCSENLKDDDLTYYVQTVD